MSNKREEDVEPPNPEEMSIPSSVKETENKHDELTEQIDASFGPMSVYVSGTDPEEIRNTFDHVWETVLDLYEDTMDEHREQNNSGNSRGPKSFGD